MFTCKSLNDTKFMAEKKNQQQKNQHTHTHTHTKKKKKYKLLSEWNNVTMCMLINLHLFK